MRLSVLSWFMIVSVDGGSLAQTKNRGGNLTFTENLLKALSLYDKKNVYEIYTLGRLKHGWMKLQVSLKEVAQKKDVFLALNQAMPLVGPKKIISFCHGLSYYYFPQYYRRQDCDRLNKQLKEMIKKSDKIVVSSIKVLKELKSIFPGKDNIEVIPFGIPYDVVDKLPLKKEKIILALGAGQPIKNIDYIIKSYRQLITDKAYRDYKLILIGSSKPRKSLIKLYQTSSVLLTASHYESFNFPVIEALSCGCPVVGLKAAIIPEMEKFIEIATQSDFVEKIKKTISNPKKIDYDDLKGTFSWESYVKKLVILY